MGAGIADQLAPIPMSATLGQTLARAAQYAQEQSHTEVALDHLLLSLTEDEDARQVMMTSGVEISNLQTDVSEQIGRIEQRLPPGEGGTAAISDELRRILNAAAVAARAGRRNLIDGAIVLAAIIGDGRTNAAGLLRAHGLTFEAAIQAIRQTTRTAPEQPASPPDEIGKPAQSVEETAAEPPAPATEPIPAPTPAPQPAGSGQRAPDTSEILANARARIADRRVLGYSEKVEPAGEDDQFAQSEISEQQAASQDGITPDTAEAEQTAAPPETADFTNPPEPAAATPGQDAPAQRSAPAQPPPTSRAQQPRPATPSPVAAPPGPGWAPPPSGPAPTVTAPTPRGAPPPIPPGVPSRPPASVPAGQSDAASHERPGGEQFRREPPWTGPPAARNPPAPHPGGGYAAPLPSPEEVFGHFERATVPQQSAPPPPSVQPSAHPSTVMPGQLIETIPRRMRVGLTVPVEVRIAKADVKAISHGLDVGNTAFRHEVRVTKAMSVRLLSPEGGFYIETASPETQWIENALGLMADDYARWRWSITPKLRGRRRLQLIVAARTIGPDGLAAETALPDQIIEIKVSANYGVLAKRAAGWTIAAVMGGLLAQFGAQIWTALEPFIEPLMRQ